MESRGRGEGGEEGLALLGLSLTRGLAVHHKRRQCGGGRGGAGGRHVSFAKSQTPPPPGHKEAQASKQEREKGSTLCVCGEGREPLVAVAMVWILFADMAAPQPFLTSSRWIAFHF